MSAQQRATFDDVSSPTLASVDDVIAGLSSDALNGLLLLSVLEGPISRYFYVQEASHNHHLKRE